MPPSQAKLILASTSPRRREILSRLQIPFDVIPPTYEEDSDARLSAKEEALLFAEGKARSVALDQKNAIVIGSDTLIEYQSQKIGKPENPLKAKETLQRLQGKTHHIWTAVFLIDTSDGTTQAIIEKIEVALFPMTDVEIEAYIKTGEPLDKAGSYAVQGIGRKFIRELKGDVLAAIGLPLQSIMPFLHQRNFVLPIMNVGF